MGRSEQDELTAAQILYPCMQCADIFFLKVLIFYSLNIFPVGLYDFTPDKIFLN